MKALLSAYLYTAVAVGGPIRNSLNTRQNEISVAHSPGNRSEDQGRQGHGYLVYLAGGHENRA